MKLTLKSPSFYFISVLVHSILSRRELLMLALKVLSTLLTDSALPLTTEDIVQRLAMVPVGSSQLSMLLHTLIHLL